MFGLFFGSIVLGRRPVSCILMFLMCVQKVVEVTQTNMSMSDSKYTGSMPGNIYFPSWYLPAVSVAAFLGHLPLHRVDEAP